MQRRGCWLIEAVLFVVLFPTVLIGFLGWHDDLAGVGTLGEWFAGCMTAAAVGVALWLGLRDSKRRDTERGVSALALRTMLIAELFVLRRTAKSVPLMADSVRKSPGVKDVNLEKRMTTMRYMERGLMMPMTQSCFEQFKNLGSKEVTLLAELVGLSQLLRRQMNAWIEHHAVLHPRRDDMSKEFINLSGRILKTIDELNWLTSDFDEFPTSF